MVECTRDHGAGMGHCGVPIALPKHRSLRGRYCVLMADYDILGRASEIDVALYLAQGMVAQEGGSACLRDKPSGLTVCLC